MAEPTPSTSLYLKPGRLSDVLALIQVLAYNKFAKRTHAGLVAQLRRPPLTAPTWVEIGRQHPELFRVLEAEKHSSNQETVTLIARFVQEGVPGETPDEPPKSLPLTPDLTSKLMDLAIQLHDREVQRRDRWKSVLVPTFVAVIAAVASITGALIGYMKPSGAPANTTTAAPVTSEQGAAVKKQSMEPAPTKQEKVAPNSTVETDARKSGARGSP